MNRRQTVSLVLDIVGTAARFGFEVWRAAKTAPTYGAAQAEALVKDMQERTSELAGIRAAELERIKRAKRDSR